MIRLKQWTVTAIDEFDRVFNYSQIQNPLAEDSYLSDEFYHRYSFEIAAYSILKAMGEDAKANWYCVEETIEWDWN